MDTKVQLSTQGVKTYWEVGTALEVWVTRTDLANYTGSRSPTAPT